MILSTLSYSWKGLSSMLHPRNVPHSSKVTQITTKIIRFGIAVFFMCKEGKAPFKPSNVNSFWFFLPSQPTGVALYPFFTHGPFSALKSNKKYHQDNQILLRLFSNCKEGKTLLKPPNIRSFWFVLPVTLLGWRINRLSPQGLPLRAPKLPKIPPR